MLKWVEPLMWWLCRLMAFVLQLVGLIGVFAFVLIGAWVLIGHIDHM